MESKLKMIMNLTPSTILSQSTDYNWVQILQLKPKVLLGISSDGTWVIRSGERFWLLDALTSYWHVFILLERPLPEVREQVWDKFVTLNISGNVDEDFPFVQIINAAFEVGTAYWANLAFHWYDELPYEKKELLKEALIKIIEQKKGSQRFRHKAMKELRRICPKSEMLLWSNNVID